MIRNNSCEYKLKRCNLENISLEFFFFNMILKRIIVVSVRICIVVKELYYFEGGLYKCVVRVGRGI